MSSDPRDSYINRELTNLSYQHVQREIAKPMRHHRDCDWHVDQYPWECTCGLTGPRMGWVKMAGDEDRAREPVSYLLRAYQAKIEELELAVSALEQKLFEASLEIEELEERDVTSRASIKRKLQRKGRVDTPKEV